MPKTAAIECLARSIGKMPLSPEALAETFAIASSLIQLLPVQSRDVRQGVSEIDRRPTAPEWMPMAVLCLSLALGVLINAISDRTSTATANATPPTMRTAYLKSIPNRTEAKSLFTPAVSPER